MQNMRLLATPYLLAAILFVSVSPDARAGEESYEIGVRLGPLLGDGVPANDIPGFGLTGRYFLRDGWFASAALDNYTYDFESPAFLAGIRQDQTLKTIDADSSLKVLSAALGRRYGDVDRGFHWYWTAGVGVGFPDVEDIAGPTDSGGTFDLTFDTGTEIHLMTALGATYQLTPNWSLSGGVRVEHHIMDILIRDRVSGAERTIDSQSPKGVYLGASYRF